MCLNRKFNRLLNIRSLGNIIILVDVFYMIIFYKLFKNSRCNDLMRIMNEIISWKINEIINL